jgi:RHS repeat-associated protein
MNFPTSLRAGAVALLATLFPSHIQAQANPLAEAKRFTRVPGNAASFQSFVIPLDSQKGVEFDPTGNNSSKFNGATGDLLPWPMRIAKDPRRHVVVTGTTFSYDHQFDNPLVAFGSSVGGTPLYTGQFYHFGVYGGSRAEGTPLETTNSAQNYYYDAVLRVYSKQQFGPGATSVSPALSIPIRFPRRGTPEWKNYITAGYQIPVPEDPSLAGSGTEILVKLVEDTNPDTIKDETWGTEMFSPVILSIKTNWPNLLFVYEHIGLLKDNASGQWLPTTAVMSAQPPPPVWNRLFCIEFDQRPSWRSTFIHQPHFAGEPVPPAYVGKSLEELLHISSPVTKQLGAPVAAHSTIDGTPELRRHPELDKLVADLDNDPVAITNLVLNEIGLTDAIAYNDNGDVTEASINAGGINRGALATYLEGQGSPPEQCSLLIYMLRQAGYPSVYVFPPHNGLKMLDTRMSSLLRMQFRGLADNLGEERVPTVIPVNYPWVATYVPDPENPGQSKWVHLFPWLKDTEIKEGQNLYDLLPVGYRTGTQWVEKYLNRDSSIFSLSATDDTVSSLFPKFITAKLNANSPTLSVADLGVQVRDRKTYFSELEEFPQPWSVSEDGGAMVVRDNLNSIANVFDTVKAEIWSDRNSNGQWDTGEPRIQTGDMRSVDIHNRRLLIDFTRTTGDNHTMKLAMTPYRPGVTGTGSFGTSDPTWLKPQVATTALISTDYNLKVKVSYARQRTLPMGFDPGERWDNPFGFFGGHNMATGSRLVETTSDLAKGDLAALCFSFGRVSQKMVEMHAREFWAEEKRLKTQSGATGDAAIFQGSTANIMGMSYFEKTFRSQAMIKDIHKVNIASTFSHGLAKIGARRNANGTLINTGEIDLVYPVVDMAFNWLAYAGNGSLRPDQQAPRVNSMDDFVAVAVADISAGEHESINTYFGQTAAVSTVKLFHLAKAAGQSLVEMTISDYAAKGEVNYTVGGTTKKLKDWAGTSTWAAVTNGFASNNIWKDHQRVLMTPGAIVMDGGSYKGVGTYILTPTGSSALITPNINGGFGKPAANYSFASSNFSNISLSIGNNFSPKISYTPPSTTSLALASPTFSVWNAPTISSYGTSNFLASDSFTSSWLSGSSKALTTSGSWSGSTFSNQYSSALTSTVNSGFFGKSNFLSNVGELVSDPVNVLTGEFYLDAVDLTLPGPMPLEIRRNYGSQNLSKNQFGHGWKLTYMPYLVVGEGESLIYAAEMDGSVIAYRRTSPTSSEWVTTSDDNPRLQNKAGDNVGSFANLMKAKIVRSTVGADIVHTLTGPDGSLRTFKKRAFQINASIQRDRPYLDKWQDSSGNSFTFHFYDDAYYGATAPGPEYGELRRIVSSNGNFVGFYYDSSARVVEAFTRDGRRVIYGYDTYGDLVRVTRPDASVVEYEYKHESTTVNGVPEITSLHLLERELKPEGRILKNVYDSSRRVTEQWATVGTGYNLVKNAAFVYTHTSAPDAPLTGNTVVTGWHDATHSYPTTHTYANGLITNITDPLNQQEIQEWYLPGDTSTGAYPRSLKKRIDKRGLITEFQYDSNGNISQKTVTGNLVGEPGVTNEVNTTTYLYNARNRVREILTTGDHKTILKYENSTFPDQVTTTEKWSGTTLVSTSTNSYYSVISGNRAAYGLLQQEIRATGTADEATVVYTHSPEGFVLTKTQSTGTTDPTVVTEYRHNFRGELVEEEDAIGRTWHYLYDDLGRRTGEERRDEMGTLVWWNYSYYNKNGELEWVDGPRSGPEDYTWKKYDGGGRPLEEIRWRSQAKLDGSGVEAPRGDTLHATTFFKHDYFNNLVETSTPYVFEPAGARSQVAVMTYDAIGQLTEKKAYERGTNGTLSLLAAETFQHEPGGEVSVHVNPLGGQTKNFFTSTGLIRRQENPDGSVLQWRYYLDGRLWKEILRNGCYWETVNDDATRTTTRTYRKPDGSALGSEITITDRRGNVISKKDIEDHAFVTTFDDLDRVKAETGPAATASSGQRTKTYFYDNCGKTLVVKDGANRPTTTTFDSLNRPTRVDVNGERVITWVYSADHHKTTVTKGEGADKIVTRIWTDTFGNVVLTKDAADDFDLTAYDNRGLRIGRIDPHGLIYKFDNDGLGRLKGEQLPDTAQTTYVYDNAGNMTFRVMPGGIVWQALYDNANRKTNEQLVNGTTITRQFAFEYYPTGSATVGMLKKSTNPRGIETTVDYDDYLRVKNEVSVGTAAEHNMTRVFTHDRRGLLKQVIQNYGNPTTGPPTIVDREIDAYGEITRETITLDGEEVSRINQAWDASGNRSTRSVGASSTLPIGYTHDASGALTALNDWNANNYTYPRGDHGLLLSRANPWRTQTATLRDSSGRLKTQTTTVGASNPLIENLNWRDDSKISSYAATRTGAGAVSESRAYDYNSRNQLYTESYAPASGQSATLTYQFDSAKRGIRTSAKAGTGAPANWEITASTVQGIARITDETTTAEPIVFTTTGNAFGAASVDVAINGFSQGRAEHTGWEGTGDWSKQLRTQPGNHILTATARHPSGQYSPAASHNFSANIAQQTVSTGHDDAGNVTTRTFSGGRVQMLTWDVRDRLIRVAERDANDDGYDWTAIYDGLGRRARTSMTDVKAGDALPHQLVTESIYDPEVEFLEIANTINGKRTWKIHGPDLDGSFGGLQGIGGLEATIQETGNISTGILTDAFGNGVGTISGTSLTWHPNRVGSYGALPGHVSLTPNESVTIAQATAWRGKTADATGFHYLGARYYEPTGGRFLSADPAGHGASISLYDYANGDPVNFADPDGRIGKAIGGSLGIQSSSSSGISYRAPSYGITNNSFKTVSTFTPTNTAGNILSAGFNMIPVLGTVKSYIELSSGNDLFTGAQISHSQSAINVLTSAVPFAAGSVSRFGTQAIGTSMGSISGGAMNVSRPAINIGSVPKITPSDFARSLQGSGSYTGVDRFRDITLQKGKIIFGGAPGQSNFYTTTSGLNRAGGSSSSLFQGLQVDKAGPHIPAHPITGGYRPGVTAYEVIQNIPAAFGRSINNPQFGSGRFPQIVVENYSSYLRPLYSIPLGR